MNVVQNLQVDRMWKFAEGGASSGVALVTLPKFKTTRRAHTLGDKPKKAPSQNKMAPSKPDNGSKGI
ncbi:hypothetical protein TNCV_4387311 [Trichonephila clavipes]|nr:hypothetical protein TNCV_4387311 [Trichonephila clavipes]